MISILFAGVFSQAHAVEEQAVSVEMGVRIPMRDGINLAATVYTPKDMQEPLPAILHLTCYIADSRSSRALWFTRRGYVHVTVDSRGRGNSEGEFRPFVNEGHDGWSHIRN